MSPRGNKRHPVSPADARAYLAKASSWLEAAEENLQARRWDVVAGSAGISACDALTGALVGQRAGGEHNEAVDLLTETGNDGARPHDSSRHCFASRRPLNTTQLRSPRATRSKPSRWPPTPRRTSHPGPRPAPADGITRRTPPRTFAHTVDPASIRPTSDMRHTRSFLQSPRGESNS